MKSDRIKREEEAIVVFTARSPERIIKEGGSQAWVLNRGHARNCKFLVCCQNRNHKDHEFSDATKPHGSAFLVGKISGIQRSAESTEHEERWLITISEYAVLDVPDFWGGLRNPVRYMPVSQLRAKGIDLEKLEFKPMPEGPAASASVYALNEQLACGGMTIAKAKESLAATFGVKPEAIEITIRG